MSVTQLRELGSTKDQIHRRVTTGRLHRIHHGVYAVGHLALTRQGREMAAVLACGPEALLGHRSAGAGWAVLRWNGEVDITAPRSRAAQRGMVVHRSRFIHPDDRAEIDGIPVTSLARTLVDLADVLTQPRLADAIHEAEVRRLFDLGAVEQALERVPGRSGRHRLERALVAYAPPPFTRSEAERRFLALCQEHGLPRPRTAVLLGGYELDFLWPDVNVAVEVDGTAAHHTRKAFHADRRRDRSLAALGIQSLRVTWRDLDEPHRLADELKAARAARGDGARR